MDVIKLHDKYFKPFLSKAEIETAVKRVALAVAADYKDQIPIFVGV
ncbi:MAG: adenylate kinase, partial [Psychroserpens sp.]